MRRALRVMFLMTLLATLVIACRPPEQVSQEQASTLARSALLEYSKTNSMDPNAFGPPQAAYNQQAGVWEFYFETSGEPKHRVNILVDRFKHTEIHTIPDH
jgi:hypothetical protein